MCNRMTLVGATRRIARTRICNVVMNARPYFVMLSVFTLCGCSFTHVGSLSRLVVTGRVFDKHTNHALADVNVTFIDTGFDSIRSQRKLSWAIGQSDPAGNMKIIFDYWWGADGEIATLRTKKTFAIELSKEHYDNERFPFDAAVLSGAGNELPVNLGNVFLRPETP